MLPITEIEVKGHLGKLSLVLPILMQVPAQELIDVLDRWNTLGPLIDPTSWMEVRNTSAKNEAVLRALLPFQAVIAKAYPAFIQEDHDGD